jgi:hypothetical protein
MIVLQIFMVPSVVLLLLIGIFLIGSTGIENVGYPTQSDQPHTRVTESDLIQINTQICPSYRSQWPKKTDEGKVDINAEEEFQYQSGR